MLNNNTKINAILKSRLRGQRLSLEDAVFLYQHASLSALIRAAYKIKYQYYGKKVYYIQNVHIEPTNYCIYKCKFCSFHKEPNEKNFWEENIDSILQKLDNLPESIKEIHITGGVHPKRDLYWYIELLKSIKKKRVSTQIKAFTAIEINYMCKKAKISTKEGLQLLKEAGLNSLAGGGAEIFNKAIRDKLCPEKGSAEMWLNIHKEAHLMGIVSNATMLYGHIETIEDRLEHMEIIRNLQDETHGFNCFIPLKFRKQDNFLSHLNEIPFVEDLKLFAISRLFFDNIPHIKAYWPMIGREKALLLLYAGADDIDGTIYDSTKIYSMAGSEEQKPSITVEELKNLISAENFVPVERDLYYKEII
ncbi:MAG: radical SAM protein [Bacteroidales bacterium]